MREIKFRAWDKNLCIMAPVAEIDFNNKVLSHYGKSEPVYNVPFEDCVIMHYTGLKDCEGREIYEGDIIIKWGGTFHDGKHFGIANTEIIVLWNVEKMGFNIDKDEYLIIGNIYQTHELLEEIKEE